MLVRTFSVRTSSVRNSSVRTVRVLAKVQISSIKSFWSKDLKSAYRKSIFKGFSR